MNRCHINAGAVATQLMMCFDVIYYKVGNYINTEYWLNINFNDLFDPYKPTYTSKYCYFNI